MYPYIKCNQLTRLGANGVCAFFPLSALCLFLFSNRIQWQPSMNGLGSIWFSRSFVRESLSFCYYRCCDCLFYSFQCSCSFKKTNFSLQFRSMNCAHTHLFIIIVDFWAASKKKFTFCCVCECVESVECVTLIDFWGKTYVPFLFTMRANNNYFCRATNNYTNNKSRRP